MHVASGEALGVQADYHTQNFPARTAKLFRFKKFRRGVARKGYKAGDFTRAMVNKLRKEKVSDGLLGYTQASWL